MAARLSPRQRLAATLVLVALAYSATGARAQQRALVLATTTSVAETGLIDSLAPLFERLTHRRLRVVAVGSGQALRLAERGDADVVLSHSPAAEEAFMRAGTGTRRRVVATNYFTIVGPANDPARVREAATASEALRRIAAAGAVFVSRGDSSGTHARELALWRQAGGRPDWPRYLEAGAGQSATLMIADERRGYALTDRGTFAGLRAHLALAALRGLEAALLNVYHVIEVSAAGRPHVDTAGARIFADFMTSQRVQDFIAGFARERYGEPLFNPARGVEPQ